MLLFYLVICGILIMRLNEGENFMIIDEVKKANIQAIRDKDTVARNIYSVLLNKFMLEGIKRRETGKEMQDADYVQILQKTIKELTEEAENYKKVNHFEQVEEIEKQIKLVEGYLPKMMSNEEIKEVILSLDDKTVPNVMKHFKANYAGKCDMRLVQEVLKSL